MKKLRPAMVNWIRAHDLIQLLYVLKEAGVSLPNHTTIFETLYFVARD